MKSAFRLAFRQLVLAPGFSIVCILTLALGIGAATTAFTAYHSVQLRPIPLIRDPDGIMAFVTYPEDNPDEEMGLSYPDYLELNASAKRIDGVAVHQARTVILSTADGPERVVGSAISCSTFGLLGVKPALGRDFEAGEEEADAPLVTLLGHDFWTRRFRADPAVLGTTIDLNGQPAKVVGIMPPGWNYPDRSELWIPLRAMGPFTERGTHFLRGVTRIRPGETRESAGAEVAEFARRLAREHPEFNEGVGMRLEPFRRWIVRDSTHLLRLLLVSVLCVQWIACANVANLVLARGSRRAGDIAMRRALGASTWQLVAWLLAEVLVLAGAGCLLGIVLAVWGTGLVRFGLPDQAPFWLDLVPGSPVIAFAAALGTLSVMLAGLIPALTLARQHPDGAIRVQGRGSIGAPRPARFQAAIVGMQVALALALLAGAGLMARSYRNAATASPGFEPNGLLTFRVGLPPTLQTNSSEYIPFFEKVRAGLLAEPGVVEAGGISQLPASGAETMVALEFEGKESAALMAAPSAHGCSVTPGALETLGTRLIRGRLIDSGDRTNSMLAAVVDESFARTFFPEGGAILRRFRPYQVKGSTETNEWFTIVGIVGDMAARFDSRPHIPTFHIAHAQSPIPFLSMVMRTRGNPESLEAGARAAVFAVDPRIPIYNVEAFDRILQRMTWDKRFFGLLFGALATLSLFLASLGVYGVTTQWVTGRAQELGVRIALGASRSEIVGLVLRQGLGLVAVGSVLGVIGGAVLARTLREYLFQVSPNDTLSFAAAVLLLTGVAAVACVLPALRALRIAPMAAVRGE